MALFPLSFALLLGLASARQVNISIDASDIIGDLPPTARFFGADEPNQATYSDGRQLIKDLGNLGPHQTYFRTHNLLTTCDPPNNTHLFFIYWGCT